MTMFPSEPMPAAAIDEALGDATPTTAPAPATAPEPAPKSELAKLLDKPMALVGYKGGEFVPDSMEGIQRMATMFVDSGLYPQILQGCQNRAAMIARMTIALSTGEKIGLTYHAAANNLAMINNRLSLWGDSMVACVRRRPECHDIHDEYDEKTQTHTCVGQRKRADGSIEFCTRTFSVEDAKRAKLWGKSGPWTNTPQRMLQIRARAFVLRDLFADFMYGVAIAEEMQDIEASEKADRQDATGSKLAAIAAPQ